MDCRKKGRRDGTVSVRYTAPMCGWRELVMGVSPGRGLASNKLYMPDQEAKRGQGGCLDDSPV